MKNPYILILLLFSQSLSIHSQHLNLPYGKGSMWFMVDHGEASSMKSVKIDCPLNGDDIYWLRKLAGAKYGKDVHETDLGALEEIDLADARIAAGGDSYYFQGIFQPYSSRIAPQSAKLYTQTDTIGKYMFMGCHRLRNVTLPSTLKHINPYAFTHCENLQVIRSTATTPPTCSQLAFADDETSEKPMGIIYDQCQLIVPTGCKEAYQAAEGWKSFANIQEQGTGVYGDEFTTDEYTYRINSPQEVTLISSPESLAGAVTLPSQVEHNGRFYVVTAIDAKAFYLRRNITAVQMPQSVRSIGQSAFYGCRSLNQVSLPEELDNMGAFAFQNCTKLSQVTLPKGLQVLPFYAFMECPLEKVTFPEGLERIGDYALMSFMGASIELPASLQFIGYFCFNTTTLKEVICHSVTPIPLLGANGDHQRMEGYEFWHQPSYLATVKLYVPDESMDAYRQANVWKDFDIHPLSEYVANAIAPAICHETTKNGATGAVFTIEGHAIPAPQRGVMILKRGEETHKVAVK